MAACAGVPDELETEWHQVQKEITCFICRNIFTDPRILSCSHTFCRHCIEERIEQAQQNEALEDEGDDEDHDYINTACSCPLCLAPLPEDGASTTWIDSTMSCLIEIYRRKEDGQRKLVEVNCGNCVEEHCPITTWCLICRCALCKNCNTVHTKRKGFESHTTVNIKKFVQIHREPCRIHIYQMLDLCCETCEHLVCIECIVEQHLEHTFELVNTELAGGAQIITSLREMAKEREHKRNKRAIKIPKKQTKIEEPPLYVGMYDFLATDYNELSFSKGDLLYIISDDGDWWFAKAKESGREGYIPRTFIVERRPLQEEEWFFGSADLKDAKRKLLHSCNADGAFLVYEHKDAPGEYSLAMRNSEKVANYRIRCRDGQYFIELKVTFGCIQELVAHYSKPNNQSFIKTTLKRPCSKSELQPSVHRPTGILEIEKKQICFVTKLGEGHVGVVWQGVWNGITPVSVKIIKPGLTGMKEFLGELRVIKQLKHPNLAEFYAMSTREEPIYIVNELARHGSLLDYLRGDGLSLQLTQQVNIMTQVATGMAYLEGKGFMHCNLAARNVIVCDNLVCRVADFAYGQLVYHHTQTKDFCIKWTAPEAYLDYRFSIKSDVWSFGIVIYEVITYGSFPYPGMNNELVKKNLKSGARMWRPMRCPEKLYKIMRSCWKEVPDERPTFETLQWQLDDYFIEH